MNRKFLHDLYFIYKASGMRKLEHNFSSLYGISDTKKVTWWQLCADLFLKLKEFETITRDAHNHNINASESGIYRLKIIITCF